MVEMKAGQLRLPAAGECNLPMILIPANNVMRNLSRLFGANMTGNDVSGRTGAAAPNSDSDEDEFPNVIARLTDLQQNVRDSWLSLRDQFNNVEPTNRESARNLVHYLALRRYDLRKIQNELARYGISSLGRSESHVMSNINKVLKLLHRALGQPYQPPEGCDDVLSLDLGGEHLADRTAALLGPPPKHRKVRIMVTLPSEAADDYELVRDLVADGMNCARINCAHDSPATWKRMVDNVRAANAETGRDCRISIDLAGPKLRSGQFEPGLRVIKWHPDRDELGRVVRPARIWLTASDDPISPQQPPTAQLQFERSFLDRLNVGDKIGFRDASRSRRKMTIVSIEEGGLWAETRKNAFISPETRFKLLHNGRKVATAFAEGLPALEQSALLHKGDFLILTSSQAAGTPEVTAPNGEVISPARVPCSPPEIFDDLKVGEKIWFDDGKLGGVITAVCSDEVNVKITQAGPAGHQLRADKGINLPKSRLSLPALTDKDLQDLKFVVQHADMVGYSFVHTADDVRRLQMQLKGMGNGGLGIILKIETRAAFDNLPDILLAALESPVVGVMIARGDLAVEAGFERLAELQEEILWMCEAAHIPVIWATQVLERLSKKGEFSRAEITDAAMSERAECVMLNKGPFVLAAVQTLDNILKRMESHQHKKRSMMRPLKLAERFFSRREEKHNWLESVLF